ncbi:MAG: glucosyltransferase domain-containing protein [Eubacteriales bacterium]|nr:glucosyltransferase domain-containing protein [Eubacteriales bacterium]
METAERKRVDSESVLKRWFRNIPKHSRFAFLSSFFVGLLVHLYMLTNKFPNHDDIAGMFTSIDFTRYGRWLSKFFTQINTNLSMPWVNGVIALLFAAVIAALIVSILKIRRPLFAALTGAVVACTPFMANTFTYMSGADVFLIAVFFSVLGVFFLDRNKYGFIVAAVLFTVTLAIYQGMVLFAIALMAIRLLQKALDPNQSDREILLSTLRYVLTIAIAALLYVGLTKLILFLSSADLNYQNTAEILSPKLSELPQRLLQCYIQFARYAFGRTPYFNTRWMLGLFLLIVFAFCLLVVLLLLQNKRLKKWRMAFAALLLLLLPVAFNSAYLTAGYAHILMLHPLTMLFIGLIALFCQYADTITPESGRTLRFLSVFGSWFVVVAMVACCYSWALYSNQVYFTLQRKFDACYSLSTRIVDRVEQLPEYTSDTPILIVGDFSEGNYPLAVPEAIDGLPYSVGIGESSEFYYMKGYWGTVHNFIAAYLGVHWNMPDSETVQKIVDETNDFSGFPAFPSEGSVRYLDGVIIVIGSAS